jgi:beta-lactamase class A
MRVVASAAVCGVAAVAVMSAIVMTGSFMREVTLGARLGLPGPAADARPAAAFSADVVRRLDALVAAFPGKAGVWIADSVSTAPLYSHAANTGVVSASLYKLGVLLEAERRVERGDLHYRDSITIQPDDVTDEGSAYEAGTVLSIDQALEAMITVSDNGAALAVLRLVGGEAIDATLERAGIADFHVTLDKDGNTMATPRAVATFFTLLARKQLISASASERMLARLERQRINDRLPAGLPDAVVVAHKTGNLVGLTHDAGIIFTPAGPRIVVVMTRDAFDGANKFIADLAATVYGASSAGAHTP